MKIVMILSIIFNGQVAVSTAEFDDIEACNAAGRAFMERTQGKLEVLWECSEKKST